MLVLYRGRGADPPWGKRGSRPKGAGAWNPREPNIFLQRMVPEEIKMVVHILANFSKACENVVFGLFTRPKISSWYFAP